MYADEEIVMQVPELPQKLLKLLNENPFTDGKNKVYLQIDFISLKKLLNILIENSNNNLKHLENQEDQGNKPADQIHIVDINN